MKAYFVTSYGIISILYSIYLLILIILGDPNIVVGYSILVMNCLILICLSIGHQIIKKPSLDLPTLKAYFITAIIIFLVCLVYNLKKNYSWNYILFFISGFFPGFLILWYNSFGNKKNNYPIK